MLGADPRHLAPALFGSVGFRTVRENLVNSDMAYDTMLCLEYRVSLAPSRRCGNIPTTSPPRNTYVDFESNSIQETDRHCTSSYSPQFGSVATGG